MSPAIPAARGRTARRPPRFQAVGIRRFSRVVAEIERAEAFYRGGLGFQPVSRGPVDHRELRALGVGGADGGADAASAAVESVMRLGSEEIALVQFAVGGRPYPIDSHSSDRWFQHLAIVVNDMDAAYRRLRGTPGWQAISSGGPQTLPASNGGVRAFKFRDPDGHPLELIWFPPGQGRAVWHAPGAVPDVTFLGIDHGALAVAATPASLGFYHALGLRVASRSLNRGEAQARLDGLASPTVWVTALRPPPGRDNGPGLELLAYRPPGRVAAAAALRDAVTDWVTLAVMPAPGDAPRELRDPDGHRVLIVPASAPVT